MLRSRAGSSPLARGLLAGVPAWCVGGWIIPARAGFTTVSSRLRRRTGDHPRSRGVYGQGPSGAAHLCGSSPLARGLRFVEIPRENFGRIIPARAGFTMSTEAGDW